MVLYSITPGELASLAIIICSVKVSVTKVENHFNKVNRD